MHIVREIKIIEIDCEWMSSPPDCSTARNFLTIFMNLFACCFSEFSCMFWFSKIFQDLLALFVYFSIFFLFRSIFCYGETFAGFMKLFYLVVSFLMILRKLRKHWQETMNNSATNKIFIICWLCGIKKVMNTKFNNPY